MIDSVMDISLLQICAWSNTGMQQGFAMLSLYPKHDPGPNSCLDDIDWQDTMWTLIWTSTSSFACITRRGSAWQLLSERSLRTLSFSSSGVPLIWHTASW